MHVHLTGGYYHLLTLHHQDTIDQSTKQQVRQK